MRQTARAAFYVRVNADDPDTQTQRRALTAAAKRRGWTIIKVYDDKGVSGARGRGKWPELEEVIEDAVKGRFDVLAVWSIDRLGRSVAATAIVLDELRQAGVAIYADQEGLDDTSPHGRAMLQMAGVFADLERKMFRERVLAGIDRAKAANKVFGRSLTPKEDRIRALLATGNIGQNRIAQLAGVGNSAVQRVKRDIAAEPAIRAALAEGSTNIHTIADRCGIGPAVVARVKREAE